MSSRSVRMYEVRIPLAVIARLTEEQRFTYYLLGHMFNELMCLQKLISYAFPKHSDTRPSRWYAEVAQAIFLFRLAAAKIWEAKLALDTKEVSATLRANILPQLENGTERWKALNAAINCAKWLEPWRNGIGFHFPRFDRWRASTTPTEKWVDDHLYMGTQSGNTFFHASESVAQAWMFGEADTPEAEKDARERVDQLLRLMSMMTSFLEDAVSHFIYEVILERKAESNSPAMAVLDGRQHSGVDDVPK